MAFSGLGAGSVADPYQITTLAQLQEAGSYRTSSYILMNDINAADTRTMNEIAGAPGTYNGFDPIGTFQSTDAFQGTFDGNYKTISNLYINRPTENYVGLFGAIYRSSAGTFNSFVRNLTLTNATIIGGEVVGILAGHIVASVATYVSTTGCNVSGTVTTVNNSSAAIGYLGQGGFAGAISGTVTLCNVTATINTTSSGENFYGVLMGGFAGLSGGVVTSCTSAGTITISGLMTGSTGSVTAGGFAGTSSAAHTSCTSTVSVTVNVTSPKGVLIGGFSGRSDGATTKCLAFGDVTNLTTTYTATSLQAVGGFHGLHSAVAPTVCAASGNVENLCSNPAPVYNAMGGFSGSGTGQATNCYATGDVGMTYGLGHASQAIGGFVGYNTMSGVITTCYSVGAVKSPATNGGGFSGLRLADTADGVSCFFDTQASGWSTSNPVQAAFTLTSASIVGGAASVVITTGSAHGYVAGNVIQITGAIPTGFNGIHIVSAVNAGAKTITYVDATMNGVSASTQGSLDKMVAYGHTTTLMQTEATYSGAVSAWDMVQYWQMATYTRANSVGNTIWSSQVDDYDNFEEGVRDSEGFSLEVPTTNTIRWMDALEALLLGTDGDEWLLMSSKLETPLTPTNFQIRQQSTFGSAAIQAVKINDVILFVDFVGRKLRELTFNGDKYVAPDLCALAEHITYPGIKWMAVQHHPDTIVWVGRSDGVLLSFTYDRSQNVLAWAKHPIGSLVGGVFTAEQVQSGCVIPNATAGEDEVWLSIKRTNITSDPVYIERFWTRAAVTDIADAYFVDAGMTFTGIANATITNATQAAHCTITATHALAVGDLVKISGVVGMTQLNGNVYYVDAVSTTVSFTISDYTGTTAVDSQAFTAFQASPASVVQKVPNLNHLVGQTVGFLFNGTEQTQQAVTSGTITLPATWTTGSKGQIGLPYTAKVQPMRIVMDTQDGSSMGSMTKVSELVLSLQNAEGMKCGSTDSDQIAIDLTDEKLENSSEVTGLFTGDVSVHHDGGFSVRNSIIVTSTGSLPFVLRAIIARIDKTGR